VVEGVVHREGAEPPAVRQVEEEAFKGAVPGAQVEEDQEAVLEAGGAVVALEVVAVADLAVAGGVVSEGHSSAGSKSLSLYRNSFALYFFFYLTRRQTEWRARSPTFFIITFICKKGTRVSVYGFKDFTSVATTLTRFPRSCSRDIIWSNSIAAAEVSNTVCSIRFV